MDDYTSQILALICNLLFFGANVLVTLVSFAFLSVTLKHLGLITEKPSKKCLGTQINYSPDDKRDPQQTTKQTFIKINKAGI